MSHTASRRDIESLEIDYRESKEILQALYDYVLEIMKTSHGRARRATSKATQKKVKLSEVASLSWATCQDHGLQLPHYGL